jgi:hypothetical protein
MAFSNSSATDPKDLLQKLNTFLAANGWTTDLSAADGAGWRLHVHKGSQYAHLRAQMNEPAPWQSSHGVNGYSICLYLGSAYSSGSAWNDQETGAPVQAGAATKPVGVGCMMQAGAVPNYYFFTDAANDNVTVVIEHQSGLYSHFGWGSVTPIGTITGGDYFFATWGGYFVCDLPISIQPGDTIRETANAPGTYVDPSGCPSWYLRVDVDSFTGQWVSGSDNTTGFEGFTGKSGATGVGGAGASYAANTKVPTLWGTYEATGDFSKQTSVQDGRANLLPIVFYAQRDGSGPGYSPVGILPTVYVSDGVGNGWSPAEDYTIGSDTYTMFPQFAVLKVV